MARFLQDYAWADAGAKVKVYIEVPLAPGASDDSVQDPAEPGFGGEMAQDKTLELWSYGWFIYEKIDLI